MCLRPLLTVLSLVALLLFLPGALGGARGDTTVSLTAAAAATATKGQREMMGTLLALLEPTVSELPGLAVLERQQIDLALQELALSEDLGRNSASRLQLGKIISADLILTLELRPPDPDKGDETPRVLIRIVESLTGAVRGASVAPIEEARLDDAATQIARYLALVVAQPDRPPVTVAVMPFESKGRFYRLRPLELGLRDMIAARLLRWSDKLAESGGNEAKRSHETAACGFLVLQRSNMRELLRELEMIQSGLADRSLLPTALPSRAAAFLVRGEIDERNTDGEFRIGVSAELVDAASGQAVLELWFESRPEGLEMALAHQIDLIAGRLAGWDEGEKSLTVRPEGADEVDSLFRRVVADLRRFWRRSPIDMTQRGFELPYKARVSGAGLRTADTPLGRALLRKSIDRLEAMLFIRPEDGNVTYSLAFCYAFHIEGIWDPERADELLRRIIPRDPNGPLGVAALRLLADISFHHHRGDLSTGQQRRALDQLLFVFHSTPPESRDVTWGRLPSRMSGVLRWLRDPRQTMAVIEIVGKEAERPDARQRKLLAGGVSTLATGLASRQAGASGPDPLPLLRRWANGDDPVLRRAATRGLAQIAEKQGDLAGAATWYLAEAERSPESASYDGWSVRDDLRMRAARCLREAGQPLKALEVLESFVPQPATSLSAGYHAVELGKCYMATGKQDQALKILVAAMERVPSLKDNTPIEELIRSLGGVPLAKDRDVDVAYVDGPDGKPVIPRVLATDGSVLFCAGGFRGGIDRGVRTLDPRTQTWGSLTEAFGSVTGMVVLRKELWVGTRADGVWHCDLAGNEWTHWGRDQGLPDDRVVTLAAHATSAFVAVGTSAAGGIARIGADGRVTILEGKGAPSHAPSCLIVLDQRLLVPMGSVIREFDIGKGTWLLSRRPSQRQIDRIFPGASHAWESRCGRELAPYGAGDATAAPYKSAWFTEKGSAGYVVRFVVEHSDRIWFGGSPWRRGKSVGFYRFDPETTDFRMYGQSDGFRNSMTCETYAGVAIAENLWIATSAGLARVTPSVD